MNALPVFTVENYNGEQSVVERLDGVVTDVYACGDLSKAEANRMASGMRAEAAAVARNAEATNG